MTPHIDSNFIPCLKPMDYVHGVSSLGGGILEGNMINQHEIEGAMMLAMISKEAGREEEAKQWLKTVILQMGYTVAELAEGALESEASRTQEESL